MKTIIDGYINEINSYLENIFKGENETQLFDAMNYSLLAGGKRIRPLIVLMCCEALGGKREDALPLAAALEMIHTYSLIHDDLPAMDNDDLRRGLPTCHKKFDEATAILAGDGLLTYAFEHIANSSLGDNKKARAISVLAGAAGPYGMVLGQALDMNLNTDKSDAVLNMYSKKTGALLNAAGALGAIAAGGSGDEFIEFTSSVGLAFQIKDDILDIESTAEELGKPIGSDEKNDKNTLVSIIDIDSAKEMLSAYTERAMAFAKGLEKDGELFIYLAQMLFGRKN